MSLPEISNEQKLTYIYYTLKDQESRRKRAIWYRLFKWMIVLGIVYVIVMYPGYIFTKISELLRPIIVEQAQTILDDNRNSITKSLNSLMKNIKEIIAESDLASAPPPTIIIPEPTKTVLPAKGVTPTQTKKKTSPL